MTIEITLTHNRQNTFSLNFSTFPWPSKIGGHRVGV